MFSKMKLAVKISLIVAIAVIVFQAGMAVSILDKIKKNSYESGYVLASSIADSTAEKLSTDFDGINVLLEDAYKYIDFGRRQQSITRQGTVDILTSYLKSSDFIYGIYTAWEPNAFDGNDAGNIKAEASDVNGRFSPYITKSDTGLALQAVTMDYAEESSQEYYKSPKEKGKTVIIPPYVQPLDDGKSIVIVSLIKPMYDPNGEFLGIIGVDIDLAEFQKIIENTKPMGGYCAIVDNNGLILAHGSKPELIGQEFVKLDATAKKHLDSVAQGQISEGYEKSLSTGDMSLRVFVPIKIVGSDSFWSLATVISDKQLYVTYNDLKVNLSILIIGIVIALLFVTLFSINYFMKPITTAAKYLENFRRLDFSQNVPKSIETGGSEIRELGISIQSMKDSLSGIVESIIGKTTETSNAIVKVENQMEDLESHVQQISAATEELSAGMQQTNATAEEMNGNSQDLRNAAKHLEDKAANGIKTAADIMEKSLKIKAEASESLRKTEEIYKDTHGKLTQAIEDAKSVEKISVLSNAILSISAQTNMLSLNAAIEAARAGEAGKGFAVVANEIRKLAEESKSTVEEIQKATKIILASVDQLSENSSGMLDFIDVKVMKDYQTLVYNSEESAKDAQYYNEFSKELSEITKQLYTTIEGMTTALQGIVQASNEGSKASTDIASTTTSIAMNSSQVLNMAVIAKDNSEKLLQLIKNIKI